jgi:signal transduction histidine kinase
MSVDHDDPSLAQQIEKLKKINASLIARAERAHEGQPNAFALFENAATVERQVRHRTEDLQQALHLLERSNDTLQQAKQMAEAANALKTTFLASVSHDLLQPLHAARLALSVLNDGNIVPAGGELIGQADRSLRTLEEIIKTLLDLSKIDAGVSKPDMRDIATGNLISELYAEFAPAAAQRGLVFRQRGSPVPVRTDPLMLRRILQNLISNAIRYTRKGGILLSCLQQAGFVRIDVTDTGLGIRKDRYRVIFDEFQRDETAAADEPGFGLGLAIVRRLALAMGHEIRLWSRPGFGSVFSILVPCAQAGEALVADEEKPLSPAFDGVQILLFAAHESAFESIMPLLQAWGCDIALSTSREVASSCLQQAERAPDLLIVSMHHNDTQSGVETVTALRTEAELSIPAILIGAASETKTDLKHIETLCRPVKPAELRALMAHLLRASI